jgi:GTP-binding protein
VVFTKLDLLGEDYVPEIEAPGSFGAFAISAAGREGLDAVLQAWWSQLLALRHATERRAADAALP